VDAVAVGATGQCNSAYTQIKSNDNMPDADTSAKHSALDTGIVSDFDSVLGTNIFVSRVHGFLNPPFKYNR
jgi:hypothetical protein